MRIGVFGATGVIGQRIVTEAVSRGHDVRAFTRNESKFPADTGSVIWRTANVLDADSVAAAIGGLDLVVNAVNAGDDIPGTIANADVLPSAARALLTALARHPSTRLLVIGGAGSLEVQPGLQLMDMPGFAGQLPDALGVPAEYHKVVLAHREALNLYRLSNRDWTYLSPSAALIKPGERTARFRTGTSQLLVRADGTSDISAEDLAVAVLDEAERPQFLQRRFTVGY
ncbi:NAD-dependent epimerase/dehydratase [Kibdelosporangium sp. 4NS15]|uniref:NAD-dependent epimerase/dehydratase n=1 Tax=Kibdelosporangium persicum TaxID=2698649 RepID=A0ABX2FDQ5_9PSEU|nr:NAD(P)H-binding protein [Kibdelosporangium persicum]NRN69348.1 NAD-dependent epimerase/dehydratase [Kibdelosporangium persicum]